MWPIHPGVPRRASVCPVRSVAAAAPLQGGTDSIHEVGLAALGLSVRGPVTRGEEPTFCSSRVLLFAERARLGDSRLLSASGLRSPFSAYLVVIHRPISRKDGFFPYMRIPMR
jgi:hypothetical protein